MVQMPNLVPKVYISEESFISSFSSAVPGSRAGQALPPEHPLKPYISKLPFISFISLRGESTGASVGGIPQGVVAIMNLYNATTPVEFSLWEIQRLSCNLI